MAHDLTPITAEQSDDLLSDGWTRWQDGWVHASAQIASTAYIGTNVRIGADCIIGPGAVIGTDGFGYTQTEDGRWIAKKHDYAVIIEPNVHIGANTCIDRGSWRDTLIGAGTRIDNLVHVAHNVSVGINVLIIAGAELSGSVAVGDGAWIGPNACVRERLTIGANALVGIGAVVIRDVPPNVTVVGNPARILKEVGVRG